MKFTLAALAALTLVQAHAHEPACPPVQTVTVTQTVQPVPSYVPPDNGGDYGHGNPYPGGPTDGYPPAAATHTVIVGGKDATGAPVLKFDPEVVYAAVGDSVVYDFRANNHSLTESTFESPCQPAGGFASGFLDNEEDIPGDQLFTVHVEDDLPHWAYCGQKQPVNHCMKGMVHAINPPLTGYRTFEAFKKNAMGGYNSPPGVPSYVPKPPYGMPNGTYPPVGYPGPTNYPTAGYPTAVYPTAVYPTAVYPTASYPSSSDVYPTASDDYPVYPTASDDYPVYPTASDDYPAYPSDSDDYPVYPSDSDDYPVYPSDSDDYPVYPSDSDDYPVYTPTSVDYPVYTTETPVDYPVYSSSTSEDVYSILPVKTMEPKA